MSHLSQTGKVLKMLRKAGKRGVENHKFPEARILRYSARIAELRQEGHNIYCERVFIRGKATGIFKYYLTEE